MPSPPEPPGRDASDARPPAARPGAPPRPARPPVLPRRDFAADEQIQRLLNVAHLHLRRGQTTEAENAVLDVLNQRPDDAAAQELLGDIRLARDDFAGACESYRAALAREPGRATAELKVARATLRQTERQRMQSLGVAYAGADPVLVRMGDGSDSGRPATAAVLGALVLPGAGQLLQGKYVPGGVLLALFFLDWLVLALLPQTKTFTRQLSRLFQGGHADFSSLGLLFWLLVVVSVGLWLYGIADTARAVRPKAGPPEKSQWDI